jgi:hypothetical protein
MKKISLGRKATKEFEEDMLIPQISFVHIHEIGPKGQMKKCVAQTREFGDFQLQAIHLSDDFDWHIGRDSDGQLLVIPTKKGE